MRKKLSRAEKRQITTNLFNERVRQYYSRYYSSLDSSNENSEYKIKKSKEALEQFTDMQGTLRVSVLNEIDSGCTFEEFLLLLRGNGFKDFEDRIFYDLLDGYDLSLEDLYPDPDHAFYSPVETQEVLESK